MPRRAGRCGRSRSRRASCRPARRREAAALPAPVDERGVGLRDVARQRQHQRDRVLRRRQRRSTAARCRPGCRAPSPPRRRRCRPRCRPADHPQPRAGGDQLGVDAGGGADDERVVAGDLLQQLGALEVRRRRRPRPPRAAGRCRPAAMVSVTRTSCRVGARRTRRRQRQLDRVAGTGAARPRAPRGRARCRRPRSRRTSRCAGCGPRARPAARDVMPWRSRRALADRLAVDACRPQRGRDERAVVAVGRVELEAERRHGGAHAAASRRVRSNRASRPSASIIATPRRGRGSARWPA